MEISTDTFMQFAPKSF